jgi:hypothetical protein
VNAIFSPWKLPIEAMQKPRPSLRQSFFYLRVLSGSPRPEMEPSDEDAPEAPRSNGWRGRVIGSATAKTGSFAITVNGEDTIGVIVAVDLERGVPGSDVTVGGSPSPLEKHYGR